MNVSFGPANFSLEVVPTDRGFWPQRSRCLADNLQARNGGDIIWPELTQPSPWDLAYRGYLLSLQDRFGEAKELWMEYLMNVQSSWEHEFLSRIWLKQELTQCVACREKPAIACFGEGGFLCFECRAFLEDESAGAGAFQDRRP